MTNHHESLVLHSRHEASGEHEVIDRESLQVATEQYLRRYEEVKRLRYLRDEKPYPQKEVERDDRDARVAYESMEDNYAKLETLGNVEAGSAGLTVAIPVAVLSEDFEGLKHVIKLIAVAQKDFGESINVVIWANAFYKGARQKKSVLESADQRYADLQAELESFSSNDVRVRIALAAYKGNIHMTNVRSDYMEAVAMMALKENNSFMHPVLWLDADTTSLKPRSLAMMRDQVQKGQVLFPHLKLHFDIDWLDANQSLSQADNATKAVAVDEINRRIAYRDNEDKGYYEESGLGFAIGTYLSSGGLNPKFANMPMPAISETNSLMMRATDVRDTRGKLQNLENPEDPKGWNIIPDNLITSDQPTQLFGYIANSRAGISARRMHKQVRQSGAIALLQYGTQLANQLRGEKKARDVNSTDMNLLLNSEHSSRPHVVGHRARIARKVIQRYF